MDTLILIGGWARAVMGALVWTNRQAQTSCFEGRFGLDKSFQRVCRRTGLDQSTSCFEGHIEVPIVFLSAGTLLNLDLIITPISTKKQNAKQMPVIIHDQIIMNKLATEEIADRIQMMQRDECKMMVDQTYMEKAKLEMEDYDLFRRNLTDWMLHVSSSCMHGLVSPPTNVLCETATPLWACCGSRHKLHGPIHLSAFEPKQKGMQARGTQHQIIALLNR
jgi:hypothetical protein